MLSAKLQHAPPSVYGVDVNQPLNADECAMLKESYDFVSRYAPRTAELISGNATASEAATILEAGLALFLTQHVALPGWMPSASLGTQYGQYGAYYALNVVGVLPGCSFFCDLEEVADSCTAQDVIDYCNAWYDAVYAAGLVPGLYVGWGIKLTSEQLYNDLKFASFWSAYNNDTPVATRGFQLKQHTQQVIGGLTVDPNTTQNDEKGDSIVWMTPA